jgi:IclR family KDG regulon transcriptional repressor
MTKPKSDYSIQTVSNALRLLEAFREEDEIGVSELARRLDLHKNNVFRLLATLEERGYIEQSPESDRYRLGTRCLELARAFTHGQSLLHRARPILESLAAALNETVHLGVLREYEVVHLDGEQPKQLVLTASRIGERLPVHCTALGKVLLGCGADVVRESFDRDWVLGRGLQRRTEATICDREKFFEHLRSVAGQGFALDLEECEMGLRCVATPVFDASGHVVAALSASGPAFRLAEDRLLRQVLPVLSAASERLSRELGYSV